MRCAAAIALSFLAAHALAQPARQTFGGSWRFRELGTAAWRTAVVPGTVQQDLFRHGLAPDPLRDGNADSVRWAELRDWEYELRFEAGPQWTDRSDATLVLKGLDTFAEVTLNGAPLGRADNMFRTWRWPVAGLLRHGANRLHVVLHSPVREGDKARRAYGIQLPHDSDPTGVSPYVRKGAWQFGWDFAPRLVTMGIWEEPALEGEEVLQPAPPRLAALDQRTDSIGRRFTFMRNGRPLFIKGCNLVPPSMFPAPDSVWTDRVRDMRRAGMNMVRVWAGGIYPPDAFFAACDTAGILVWQDLMFAHIPPAEGGFPDNVRAEVRDQAARLSRWPGLVLWCGNNELEVAWDNWGWQERYGLHGADSARVRRGMDDLFLHLLPEALSAAHGAPYTPTSPLSNWGNADGLRHGDLHYWGVWHGDSAFSSFDGNTGRFVSEYGFQSWPDSATLADQIAPEHLVLGDPVLTARQRSYKTDRPILEAIEREFAVRPRHLGELCLFSQLAQAEACRRAIWAHISAQPRCMGTLFWQLNDVWAGPSWSTVDHLGTWKAAMYEVARSYRTLVMDLRRSGEAVTAHIRSEGAEPADACLVVQVFDVGGRRLRNDSIAVTLGPEDQEVLHLQTTEALAGSPPERRIVRTALVAGKGQVLAERFLPMARLGEMAWEPARVTMVADPGRAGRYRLSTDKPVAVVRIEAPGAEIGDNYFPLVPGADREVDISGGSGPPRLSTWPW